MCKLQSSVCYPRQTATPCLLALADDKVQSINQSIAPPTPHHPQRHSPPHIPPPTALPTVTAIAIDCRLRASIVHRPPPSPVLTAPCGVLEALCLPSLPPPCQFRPPDPSTSRGSYNTSAAPSAYPQASRVGRHQTLVAAARSAADRRNLGSRAKRESALPLLPTRPVSPRLSLTYTPLSTTTTTPLHHPSSQRRRPPSPQHRRGSGATSSHPLCYCARCLVRVSHDSATSESDVSTRRLASHSSLLH